MLGRLSIPFAIAGLAALTPAAAAACAIIQMRPPTAAESLRGARDTIARATAIVDGEVIRPHVRGGPPALVRVHRVLKGPQVGQVAVGERDSCDIALTRVGARMRMILQGGPDLYSLSYDTSNPRIEDRLLGSDRRRDWPYRSGPAIPVEIWRHGHDGLTQRLEIALEAAVRASPRLEIAAPGADNPLKVTLAVADWRRVIGRMRVTYRLDMERGGQSLGSSTGRCWESDLARCAAHAAAAATAAVRPGAGE